MGLNPHFRCMWYRDHFLRKKLVAAQKLTESALNLVCQIHIIQEFLHEACQLHTLFLETILYQVNFFAGSHYLFGQHY